MNMKRLIIFFLVLIGAFQLDASAQQKFEKESRLKPEDVPALAGQFIEAVELDTRWKWYFEENLVGNSVEAKTKYNGEWYSVEFDTSGKIQDVEIETDLQEMKENVSRNILMALDSMFNSHKIDKIQIQYTAETSVLIAILNKNAGQADSKIQYEIVVKGKTTGRPKLYEFTFTDNGKLLETSEIIFRNTDNLEY
jgi:hypothetical protein